MVTKELIASAHHLHSFLSGKEYAQYFYALQADIQNAENAIKPNYTPVVRKLSEMQDRFIRYEANHAFPFENNPLLVMLDINDLVGAGAIENIKELLHNKPVLAREIVKEAPRKLQIAIGIINDLHESFDKLPISRTAKDLYRVDKGAFGL